jgi:hypothetical protein
LSGIFSHRREKMKANRWGIALLGSSFIREIAECS